MASSVLISGALASGGVQTHVTTLCQNLCPEEVRFTLFGARVGWSAAALHEVRKLGAHVVTTRWRNPVLQKLEATLQALRLGRQRFDVLLLLGTSRFHVQLLPCARPHGFAIYNEIMHYPSTSSEPLVRQMDGLIGVSRFTECQLRSRFPSLPVRRLAHFPHYASRPSSNHTSRVGRRQLRMAYLGRLDEGKRPEWLIKRWGEFATLPPVAPARLDIYGYGEEPLVRRMQVSIQEHGLSEVIQLHGSYERSALDEILSRADLVVNPSSYEGLGVVLLEAMHRGVPVVATEAGGSADLGEGNPDSLFTPGNDWAGFCAGVREMAGRLRAGTVDCSRLRKWVECHYGKEQLLRQWREVFSSPRQFFGISS